MPTLVEVGDVEIEFPDTMSPQQIVRALNEAYIPWPERYANPFEMYARSQASTEPVDWPTRAARRDKFGRYKVGTPSLIDFTQDIPAAQKLDTAYEFAPVLRTPQRMLRAGKTELSPDLMGGVSAQIRDPYGLAIEATDLGGLALDVGDLARLADNVIPPIARRVEDVLSAAGSGLNKTPMQSQIGAAGTKKFGGRLQDALTGAVDDAGNLRMTHYSKRVLDEVLPDLFGTGLSGRTRAEMNRASDTDFVNRSYWGADTLDPYVPERGLPGVVPNKAKIDVGTMYDPQLDPDGLWGKPGPRKKVTQSEKRVRDAGYGGIIFNTDRGVIPITFDPVRVPPAATDRPRVNWPDEATRPAELTRKSVGANKFKAGAPLKIKSAADERKAIDDYLAGAEQGAAGREWYDEVAAIFSRDTGNLSGQKTGRKRHTGRGVR